jgi:predicted aspartyl protease
LKYVVMPKAYSPAALFLSLGLLFGTTACSLTADLNEPSTSDSTAVNPAAKAKPVTDSNQTKSNQAGSNQTNSSQAKSQPASPSKASTKLDSFQLAVERASSAYTIGQSAQSRDDWRLVANRWQQAIELMKTVPSSNPRRTQVQQKLTEYQQNLAYAQRQASRPTTTPNPDGVVVIPSELLPKRLAPQPAPVAAAAPQIVPQTTVPPASQADGSRTFFAPIIRREGNTPVVRVMFNANQSFDMIVDTGASGTVITRPMASALKVVAVAEANVDTASAKGVTFPLGYVKSIQVGGVTANNVLVAVAGPELDIGLLGHDFFGHYDVTIRQNAVEFRER